MKPLGHVAERRVRRADVGRERLPWIADEEIGSRRPHAAGDEGRDGREERQEQKYGDGEDVGAA